MQRLINAAETMEEAVALYVSAYNCETVAIAAAERLGTPMARHEYKLPGKWVVVPALAETFDVGRKQYLWPNVVRAAANTSGSQGSTPT